MSDQQMGANPETAFQHDPDSQPENTSMLQNIWDWLTNPSSTLNDVGEQRSARLASSFLLVITILNLIGGIVVIPRLGLFDTFIGIRGLSLAAGLIAYLISRTKWYPFAVFIFAASFNALAYLSFLSPENRVDSGTIILIYVPLGLIVASAFLSAWAVFLLVGLNIASLLISIFYFGINIPIDIYGPQSGIITVIGVVLILLNNFRINTEKLRLEELRNANRELEFLSGDLERRVDARTKELVETNQQAVRQSEQLTAIAELARSLTNIQELESLLPAITSLVSQRLGYYHIGIFLNDDKQVNAVLRAANSEGGQKMLARGHRLRIGEEGIVGHVIKAGKPRIALDVGADVVYFDNPDLPNTRSEMALPLRLGSEFIGALDIQSTEGNAFSAEDLSVFTTLADQIAIAIQNARLLTQSQFALREVEEAYAEQTEQAWEKFSKTQNITGYYFDGTEPKPIKSNGKTKFDANMTLPLLVRGQTIGNLKLKTTKKNRTWNNEEITIAKAAIERATLALENARLLEDAQKRAAREQMISEGAARVSAALDVESILQTTAEELERMLGSSEIIIQLESDE